MSKTKDSSTKRIRDCSKQSKYRKKSKSKNKEKQHVAHTVDLEIAKHISKKSKGKESTQKLKKILNDKDNFRMVNATTNLGEHKEIAKALMEKSTNGKTLSPKEEKRAKLQVNVLYENKKVLPKNFIKASVKFYKNLKTKDGKKIIDGRKLK